MKLLIIVFTFIFLAVLNVATAATTSLTDIRRLNNYDQKQVRQSITEVRKALENFDLSKGDIKIREQEASAYLELAFKAIGVDETGQDIDETGDSEAFLFHTYQSDTKAFNRALQKMDEKKAVFIRYTIEQTRRALSEGQDTVN
jgi:hypothetical protein